MSSSIDASLVVFVLLSGCLFNMGQDTSSPAHQPRSSNLQVSVPTHLRIERTPDAVTVTIDRQTLESARLTVDEKMVTGVGSELRVYRANESRPATPNRLGVTEGTDFILGTDVLNANDRDFPVPQQKYIIEMVLTIFETDIPPRHQWQPSDGKQYKVLWHRTLTETVGSLPSNSQEPKTTVDQSAETAAGVLLRDEAPGGLSVVKDCERKSLVVFVLPGEKAKQAGEEIARKIGGKVHPDENGGFSICVSCRRESALLNVQVPGGEIRFETYTFAIQQLLDLSGVRQTIARLGLSEGVHIGAMQSLADMGRKEVHVRAGTLKDALNQIAESHGRAVWRLDENDCAKKTFLIQWVVH